MMESLELDSSEYKELEEKNKELKKKVSTLEGKMNKIVEKLNKLPRTLSDVENENVVEGLQPRIVRTYKILEEKEFTNGGIPVRDIADEPEAEAEAETIGETTEQIVEVEETQAESETIEAEISHLEEEIRKTTARIKEYRENGEYDQEAAERADYSKLVAKLNKLKNNIQEKEKVEQIKQEISGLEEEIRKTAARIREYRQNGDYEQEAAERADYSKLVERLHELRNNTKLEEISSPRKVINPPPNPAPQPEKEVNPPPNPAPQPEKVINPPPNPAPQPEKEVNPPPNPAPQPNVVTKPTKDSFFKRIGKEISKIVNTIRGYINNFNNKQLPAGKEEKDVRVKMNEALKETLATERVYDSKSRAAMQKSELYARVRLSTEQRREIEKNENQVVVNTPKDIIKNKNPKEAER